MDTREVIDAVNEMQEKGVIGKYALGGAVAASVWMEPFFTKDLDIFVTVDYTGGVISLSPIYDYMAQRGFNLSGQWVIIGGWKVEFLPTYNSLTEEALLQARSVPYGDTHVQVMAPEYLMAICLQTARPTDYERVLKFIEQDAFEAEILLGILERHQLMPKWERFLARYQQDKP